MEPKLPIEKKKTLGKRLLDEAIDLCKIFLVCYVVVFLITTFLLKPVRVQGESMYPTLLDDEVGVMNVFGVKFSSVERFDVVVVYNEEKNEDWVKRIIGMPNDTLYSKDDILYINGEAQEQNFLNAAYVKTMTQNGEINFTEDFGPITLGSDEYFLMGDNRPRSYDSRKTGPFTKDEFRGKDIFVLYPFDKIKLVTKE